MLLRILPILLFLACFAIRLISGQFACTATCGGGLKCCRNIKNDACYNPVEQQCIEDRILCANFEQACGDVCYDPKTHICFQNEDNTQNKLCGQGEALCGSQCFDPLQFSCFNQHIVARANDTCTSSTVNTLVQCGSDCFPPQNHSCTACESTPLQIVCPIYNTSVIQLCCSTGSTNECYDPTKSFCCANPARICLNDNMCSNGECFSSDQCCATSGPRVIPKTPTRLRISDTYFLCPLALLHLLSPVTIGIVSGVL